MPGMRGIVIASACLTLLSVTPIVIADDTSATRAVDATGRIDWSKVSGTPQSQVSAQAQLDAIRDVRPVAIGALKNGLTVEWSSVFEPRLRNVKASWCTRSVSEIDCLALQKEWIEEYVFMTQLLLRFYLMGRQEAIDAAIAADRQALPPLPDAPVQPKAAAVASARAGDGRYFIKSE